VIEILDAIPNNKGYLKDAIALGCGQLFESMWNYMLNTSLTDLVNEASVFKLKLANYYLLRVILGQLRNHPAS